MGHGIMAREVVKYSAFVLEGSDGSFWKKPETGLLISPSYWVENELPEFQDDDPMDEKYHKFVNVNGWQWQGDDYLTSEKKKSARLWGDKWTKDDKSVILLNCSQYCNVGVYEIYAVSNDKESLAEFLSDNEGLILYSKILEDEILLQWG